MRSASCSAVFRLIIQLAGALVVSAMVSACQDSPAGPTLDPTSARYAASPGNHAGEVASLCYIASAPDADYRQDTIFFPRAEVAPNGVTTLYRVTFHAAGAKQVARGICPIPRTDAAIRRLDRRFGVGRDELAPGTMVVALDPIVVRACQYGGTYPNCGAEPPPPCSFNCDGTGSDGGGGGAETGSGGGSMFLLR